MCVCVCERERERSLIFEQQNSVSALRTSNTAASLFASVSSFLHSTNNKQAKGPVDWCEAYCSCMLIVTRLLYPLSFLTLSALPLLTDLKDLGFSLSAESLSLESNQYDYGEIIQLYGMPLDNLILNLKRLAVKKCEKIYTRGPKIWGNYASHTSF